MPHPTEKASCISFSPEKSRPFFNGHGVYLICGDDGSGAEGFLEKLVGNSEAGHCGAAAFFVLENERRLIASTRNSSGGSSYLFCDLGDDQADFILNEVQSAGSDAPPAFIILNGAKALLSTDIIDKISAGKRQNVSVIFVYHNLNEESDLLRKIYSHAKSRAIFRTNDHCGAKALSRLLGSVEIDRKGRRFFTDSTFIAELPNREYIMHEAKQNKPNAAGADG